MGLFDKIANAAGKFADYAEKKNEQIQERQQRTRNYAESMRSLSTEELKRIVREESDSFMGNTEKIAAAKYILSKR